MPCQLVAPAGCSRRRSTAWLWHHHHHHHHHQEEVEACRLRWIGRVGAAPVLAMWTVAPFKRAVPATPLTHCRRMHPMPSISTTSSTLGLPAPATSPASPPPPTPTQVCNYLPSFVNFPTHPKHNKSLFLSNCNSLFLNLFRFPRMLQVAGAASTLRSLPGLYLHRIITSSFIIFFTIIIVIYIYSSGYNSIHPSFLGFLQGDIFCFRYF